MAILRPWRWGPPECRCWSLRWRPLSHLHRYCLRRTRQHGLGSAAAGCGDCLVPPYAGRGGAAAGDTIESGYNTLLTWYGGGHSLIHLRHCARPAALAAGMLLAALLSACGDAATSPTVDVSRPVTAAMPVAPVSIAIAVSIATAYAAPRQHGLGPAAAGCGDCVVPADAGRGGAAA